MYPNVFMFDGDPFELEHLKNSNISEARHVVVPCKCEDDLCSNDSNVVMKANIIKQNWPEIKISVEFSSNTMVDLIENLLEYEQDLGKSKSNSVYTNKAYENGKVFSSVLFTRMSAMKSLRRESYETITSLLKYVFDESNVITVEIPQMLRCLGSDLTYGKVREFLLFNSKISLMAIGVYATNMDEIPNYYRMKTPPKKAGAASINDTDSENDSEEESFIERLTFAIGKRNILDFYVCIR